MVAPKIIVLASYSPSLLNFRGPLIRRLVARGYAVIGCGPEDAAESLAGIGCGFERIGPSRTALNPLSDLRYAWRLLGLFRRQRPAAVIAYTIKPVIWGCLVGYFAGVPVRAAMITGLGYAFGRSSAKRSGIQMVILGLYRLALRRATAVIFQNNDDRKEFENRGLVEPGRGHVVNGSGVELDKFRPVPLPGSQTFLLIARLLVDKGIREYAAAARLVRKTYPQARFLLVGWEDKNPQALPRGELETWIHERLIEYVGRLDDVRPALSDADVYVLPSYREGTPRTVLEAMAMGRPIITTDVPGCRETVAHGVNGFLVPPQDPNALATAMMTLLKTPSVAEQMGREGRRMAEEKYNAQTVAESVIHAARL